MNLSFYIQPASVDTTTADLYLEINAHGLSYIILDNNACVALVIYHFGAGISEEAIANNIHQVIANQPILQQKFNSTHIIYGYSVSVLVPQEFMNDTDTNSILELVYGDVSEKATRADFMQGLNLYNVYGLPAVIEMVISRYFNFAEYTHLFSLLPGVLKEPGNHLYCIFSTGQLKLLLIKESKLQVMQTYSYKTPEDIAYYLLNLCKSFDVNVSSIKVHLSGMIDANSGLYNELYKYFLQLQFEGLPEQYQYPEELNQYPAHYFSHLFAVAACV